MPSNTIGAKPLPHSYDNKSNTYNVFFHPLNEKNSAKRMGRIILNIVLTILTSGLWQIPFWIVNRLDHKKIVKLDQDTTSNVTETANKTQVLQTQVLENQEQLIQSPVQSNLQQVTIPASQTLESILPKIENEAITDPVITREEKLPPMQVLQTQPLQIQILETQDELQTSESILPGIEDESLTTPEEKLPPKINLRLLPEERASIIGLKLKTRIDRTPEGVQGAAAKMTFWLNTQTCHYGFVVKNLSTDFSWQTGKPFLALADIFEDGFYAKKYSNPEDKLEAAFEIFSQHKINPLLQINDIPWQEDKIYAYLESIKKNLF